jgi:hypothetical protein
MTDTPPASDSFMENIDDLPVQEREEEREKERKP